jgi:hypothetical protein
MADMVEKGFWVVLPYKQVRDLPNLRLSHRGTAPCVLTTLLNIPFTDGISTVGVETEPSYSTRLPPAMKRMRYMSALFCLMAATIRR